MIFPELATCAPRSEDSASSHNFDSAIHPEDPVKRCRDSIRLATHNNSYTPGTARKIPANGRFSGRTNEALERVEHKFPWAEQLRSGVTKCVPSLHALQEWEGYVIEISDTEFVARLTDITANAAVEDEEAVIPLEEISDADIAKLCLGTVFRWVIGYELSGTGAKKRVSQIVFRDLPAVTKSDIQDSKAWAQETLRSISP